MKYGKDIEHLSAQ
jgi:hypothetical protein